MSQQYLNKILDKEKFINDEFFYWYNYYIRTVLEEIVKFRWYEILLHHHFHSYWWYDYLEISVGFSTAVGNTNQIKDRFKNWVVRVALMYSYVTYQCSIINCVTLFVSWQLPRPSTTKALNQRQNWEMNVLYSNISTTTFDLPLPSLKTASSRLYQMGKDRRRTLVRQQWKKNRRRRVCEF